MRHHIYYVLSCSHPLWPQMYLFERLLRSIWQNVNWIYNSYVLSMHQKPWKQIETQEIQKYLKNSFSINTMTLFYMCEKGVFKYNLGTSCYTLTLVLTLICVITVPGGMHVVIVSPYIPFSFVSVPSCLTGIPSLCYTCFNKQSSTEDINFITAVISL